VSYEGENIDMQNIKKYIETIKKDKLGFALSIQKDNTVVFEEINGVANIEYDITLSEDSMFHLASVAKQFTAYCIFLLVEEGLICLEDKFTEILIDFPNFMSEITIEDLVYHTSGIADYLTILDYGDRSCSEYFSNNEIIDIICKSSLQFNPNEKFQYSNSNYLILGLVVEKITGHSLKDFASMNIFNPLSMESTFYHDDGYSVIPNRASSYFIEDSEYKVQDYNFNLVGDGGLWSSLNDMKIWANHLLNDNLVVRLSKSRPLNNNNRNDYAFGLFKQKYFGKEVISHDGAFGCYRTAIYILPECNLSIVILVNNELFNPNEVCKNIIELLAEYKENEVDFYRTDSAKELQILGIYLSESNDIVKVDKIGDKVYFDDMFERRLILKSSDNTYVGVSNDYSTKIIIQDNHYVIVKTTNDDSKYYYKEHSDAFNNSEYVGKYNCNRYKAFMNIEVMEGILRAKSYVALDDELEVIKKDILKMGNTFLIFERNDNGDILGFQLKTPRAISTMYYNKI